MESARSTSEPRSRRASSPTRTASATELDAGRLLCSLFIEALPVSGASITVIGRSGQHCVVGVSDDRAARLEAAQFELGVGPHWEALRTGRPAFFPDGHADSWPPLAIAMGRLDARALFSFPLRLGAEIVGVADLSDAAAGERWSPRTIGLADDVARGVSGPAVQLAMRSADAGRGTVDSTAVGLRPEVHQAAGMLMARLGTDAATALLRLRAHAFATGVPLDALAHEIVRNRLRISEL